MMYRGPGFLVVVRFGSSPTPSALSPEPAGSLSQSFCLYRRSSLQTGDGKGGGELNNTTARKPGPL